ncbi:hypothetical protein EDD93_4402 [Streptomyces sp. 840.1]|uniref:hypothetical protein n=1 Tax=Streptomyces sp. 840.1 TaxID=2485152 RepID=UPI000F466020|nr:hypothetical protein [Streptomyces sp. 840.1]ROQ69899.1 hypothetical protein EDD93_4402 [Streptomyces sp. 840.1]
MTSLYDADLTGDETIETPFGALTLEHTLPTDETSELLFDQMDAQRAAQAYVWMKTVARDGWFVHFRLYGPTQPFFDRSWALPDFRAV